MTEEADILNAQDQTQDALTRIYKRGNVSFFGVSDLSPSLARLKIKANKSGIKTLSTSAKNTYSKRIKKSVKFTFSAN